MAINRIYNSMPAVAVRGIVIFPGVRFHFDIARSKSIAAVEAAMNADQKVFLVAQKDALVDDPEPSDLFNYGVIASIKQILKSPNENQMRIVVEGIVRAQIADVIAVQPYFICNVRERRTPLVKNEDAVLKDALVNKLKTELIAYMGYTSRSEDEARRDAEIFYTEDASDFADLVAGNIIPDYRVRQKILEKVSLIDRLEFCLMFFVRRTIFSKLKMKLKEKSKSRWRIIRRIIIFVKKSELFIMSSVRAKMCFPIQQNIRKNQVT